MSKVKEVKRKIIEVKNRLHDLIFYDELVPYLEPSDKHTILTAIELLSEVQKYLRVKN
jgi:hypothetical protein